MTYAVDFDAVIHAYRKGWHDGTIYDDPVPRAIEGLKTLMERDSVAVFTARTDLAAVARWLIGHGVDAISDGDPSLPTAPHFWNERDRVLVTNRKLPGKVYIIDDRGIRFTTWERVIRDTAPETADSPHVQDGASYVRFGTEPHTVEDTVHIYENVLLDLDAQGALVGIEILSPQGTPWIERPPGARSTVGADELDAERRALMHAEIAGQLLAELGEVRRIVAQWLYDADSGRGADTGDLRDAFDSTGRTLDPEMDMIEEEEGQEESA